MAARLSLALLTAALAGLLALSPGAGRAAPSHRFNTENFAAHGTHQRITWRVADTPYRSIGTLDPQKTKACRDGDFLPRVHAQFIVAAKDADLNVAWGSGLNLHDPAHLAKPTEVYLFFQGAMYVDYREHRLRPDDRCEVRVKN